MTVRQLNSRDENITILYSDPPKSRKNPSEICSQEITTNITINARITNSLITGRNFLHRTGCHDTLTPATLTFLLKN